MPKGPWEDPNFDVDFYKKACDASLDAAVERLSLIHELKGRGVYGRPQGVAADALFKLGRLSSHLSLEAYEKWNELSKEYSDAIVESLSPGARIQLLAPDRWLHAVRQRDGSAVARLVIENTRDPPGEIRVTDAIFRSAPRGDPFHARATLKRRNAKRGAGRRRPARDSDRFELILRRAEGRFAARKTYHGYAQVLAGAEVVGRLAIEVSAKKPAK